MLGQIEQVHGWQSSTRLYLLVRRVVPDRAPVLIARHRERHGVVLPPKLQHQLLVGHPSRIELHAKRLGVIADGLVRGVRRSAASVAHHRAQHPGKSSKALLGVPESSHGKRGRLTLLRLLWLRQPRAFAGHHAQRLVPSHRSTSHRSTSSQARGSRRKQQQHLCGVVRRAAQGWDESIVRRPARIPSSAEAITADIHNFALSAFLARSFTLQRKAEAPCWRTVLLTPSFARALPLAPNQPQSCPEDHPESPWARSRRARRAVLTGRP